MNGALPSSHAILDRESREKKAKKIEALVRLYAHLGMRAMLDIGTGSGYIAAYFSRLGYGPSGTYAVDITDQRQVKEGFQFQLVQGTRLPYPDAAFDFIISNHVVEHVGGSMAQMEHVREIYRCLEPGGVLYFAVPNRWRLIEPHYKLPFLSWLPIPLASAYMRLTRRGTRYDCRPLSRTQALNLLASQGFNVTEATLDAIRLVGEIEYKSALAKLITRLPKAFWKIFSFWMPTLIFVARKPRADSPNKEQRTCVSP
ncbi:class I SAM-dependent methyltransferase [Desulfofundulus thermosubterraneus]|uniref:Methyltransferase domain-containing protein n=1 Tax=Desulfofundulus thermosubterraneus DSM 16057 TaxID=1121432 RepID=A0A1M6FTW6_9FIRM|nr:class I SAM-dependent methyltransferase [Desulfofundulus thermosubterraneus]SHJ01151.1 Methyltransferase domain-containing protein [Desulfofundulus thermosubterraneus DSM 16057]